jgi:hypothetical protein
MMFEIQSRSYLKMLRLVCTSCLDRTSILMSTVDLGTLQFNLDARLWDALKCSYFVEDPKRMSSTAKVEEAGIDGDEDRRESGSTTPNALRFTLDSPIEVEGSSLSIVQRSLVSLARALVKDSKILIVDEATTSVDYETDRKIQDTIITEFHARTILCIARTFFPSLFLPFLRDDFPDSLFHHRSAIDDHLI